MKRDMCINAERISAKTEHGEQARHATTLYMHQGAREQARQRSSVCVCVLFFWRETSKSVNERIEERT